MGGFTPAGGLSNLAFSLMSGLPQVGQASQFGGGGGFTPAGGVDPISVFRNYLMTMLGGARPGQVSGGGRSAPARVGAAPTPGSMPASGGFTPAGPVAQGGGFTPAGPVAQGGGFTPAGGDLSALLRILQSPLTGGTMQIPSGGGGLLGSNWKA